MGGKDKDEVKGFAGFDALVSDVGKGLAPRGENEHSAQTVPLPEPSTSPTASASKVSSDSVYPNFILVDNQQKKPTNGDRSGKVWGWGLAFVVVLIWIASQSAKKEIVQPAATPQPAPKYAPPAASSRAAPDIPPSPDPKLSYAPTTYRGLVEERPPIGSGNILGASQIRYCLSEKIRVEAYQGGVNSNSESSVYAFNRFVDDYNARCSNFRYRRGLLESVRSEVEADRARLEQEGVRRVSANP